jgi:hypothetical protein
MTPAILVLTVLASAIAAGVATYCLNISKERLLFVARKSEELFCTIEALDHELSCFYGARYSLVDAARCTTGIEHLQQANACFATARMLVGLYFPMLMPDLARANAAAATAWRSLETLESAPEPHRRALLEALDASVCDLKDALDALKSATLVTGRATNQRALFAFSSGSAAKAKSRRVLQVQP